MLFLIYFLGVIQVFALSENVYGRGFEGHAIEAFLTAFAWPMFAVINTGALVWRLIEGDE